MKICENVKQGDGYDNPQLIAGHIYKAGAGYHLRAYTGYYLCTIYKGKFTLIGVDTGECWNRDKGYGDSNVEWKDVTDQFCLQRI